MSVDFTELGFTTASRFTRMNADEIRSLKPVTILLDGNIPVAVAVEFSRYLEMQAEMEGLERWLSSHNLH